MDAVDSVDPDPDRTRAFGEQLLGMLTGGMLTMLIGIGHRTGPQNCMYICRKGPL